MNLNSLQELFIDKLQDIYTAERKTEDLLPRFAEKCSSDEVRKAFSEHLEQSRNQVTRLEQVFSKLDMKPQIRENPVIDSLIEESREYLDSEGDAKVKDAALIAAEQEIEHYEISAYGTARSFARALGMDDVAGILQETLNEEEFTDSRLSKIAEKGDGGPAINQEAAHR
ncbi:MAG: ferritin-like domain-containing protein [Fibrobacter sp.]|jgi:ferritin-like metal-binding protein YciE|nr:ferritin-like domain-containing protein [Fibrobacter sp.]HON11257.1 ferritin-like domain-containing protein [Chitinispirillaceae bacterium]